MKKRIKKNAPDSGDDIKYSNIKNFVGYLSVTEKFVFDKVKKAFMFRAKVSKDSFEVLKPNEKFPDSYLGFSVVYDPYEEASVLLERITNNKVEKVIWYGKLTTDGQFDHLKQSLQAMSKNHKGLMGANTVENGWMEIPFAGSYQ